jgi:hypothetical protein
VARGLRIDIEGLEDLGVDLQRLQPPGLRHAIRDSLRDPAGGGGALASEMRLRAPSRTGTLVGGIGIHNQAGDDVLVGYLGALAGGAVANAREQRGAWVESGTRPHTIKAKRAEALFFGGRTVEQVEHPGSRPQKVAQKSMNAAEWEVLADVADKIDARLNGGTGGG